MKKITNLIVIVLLSTLFVSCGESQNSQTQKDSKAKLKVYYFHATSRCPSCLAAENVTKNVLDKYFKKELDNGTIEFASYNIDEDKNKPLVEKYEIMFSTLLLIKSDGAKTDFTDKAFEYALNEPEKYTQLLIPEINNDLK